MSKLILSSGFNVSEIPIVKFPGGEIKVAVPEKFIGREKCLIRAFLTDADGVMALIMLTDALRSAGLRRIRLTMPYIPYARQDRICNPGEAFSLQVFANIINMLEFSSVVVYDPHSQVSVDAFKRLVVMNQVALLNMHHDMIRYMEEAKTIPTYLVSPDKGASTKVQAIADAFPQLRGIIYGDKVRELSTGKIIKTEVKNVPHDLIVSRVLVVDDICDGGRTFIELAKALKQFGRPRELTLYVTHGIFSAGREPLLSEFDNVYSTITFADYK